MRYRFVGTTRRYRTPHANVFKKYTGRQVIAARPRVVSGRRFRPGGKTRARVVFKFEFGERVRLPAAQLHDRRSTSSPPIKSVRSAESTALSVRLSDAPPAGSIVDKYSVTTSLRRVSGRPPGGVGFSSNSSCRRLAHFPLIVRAHGTLRAHAQTVVSLVTNRSTSLTCYKVSLYRRRFSFWCTSVFPARNSVREPVDMTP